MKLRSLYRLHRGEMGILIWFSFKKNCQGTLSSVADFVREVLPTEENLSYYISAALVPTLFEGRNFRIYTDVGLRYLYS